MRNRDRLWWWLAAAAALVLGFVLIVRGDHNGWFLVVLGAVYVGAMIGTATGHASWSQDRIRWGLLGITLLLVLLAVVAGAILRR